MFRRLCYVSMCLRMYNRANMTEASFTAKHKITTADDTKGKSQGHQRALYRWNMILTQRIIFVRSNLYSKAYIYPEWYMSSGLSLV